MLIDVFVGDPSYGEGSRAALKRCRREGSLVACEVVWAEVAAAFPDGAAAREALRRIGVTFSALDDSVALAAGEAWANYRERGGKRDRVIADFLIAGHASELADRLLTRDRGFYRRYFERLTVLDPSAGSAENE